MPNLDLEEHLWARGVRLVAGLDEAGRGAWAGPLVAGAVVLPPSAARCAALHGIVQDSKVLRPEQREVAARAIERVALGAAWGWVAPHEVDALGLDRANRLAFRRALAVLPVSAEHLLLDYFSLPECPLPQQAVVDGDGRSLSIAAASVIAKVARDRLMRILDWLYPGFGLARHKGYGTPAHRRLLAQRGPCHLHRRSFAPVRACLAEAEGAASARAPAK
ncbi:MAG: ribonuclease HII [Chloroflexi bacterium]|nr:ribonuclease HII [Chloroflexota bacterium]MBI4505190.1 ribonuclease HII [Chloroflexota bacterium]